MSTTFAALNALRKEVRQVDKAVTEVLKTLSEMELRQRVILRILRMPKRTRVRRKVRRRRPKTSTF